MAVGVVADKVAVVYPHNALGAQRLEEARLNLVLCQRLVAMRCHQTAGGGEDGALAVALDATALEHKVQTVNVLPTNAPLVVEVTVDGVVELSRELRAPAVELEVEQEGGGLSVEG